MGHERERVLLVVIVHDILVHRCSDDLYAGNHREDRKDSADFEQHGGDDCVEGEEVEKRDKYEQMKGMNEVGRLKRKDVRREGEKMKTERGVW